MKHSQKSNRKFLSEFAVSLCSARFMMLWASQIQTDAKMSDKEAQLAAACHIYLICKRPATWFEPMTIKYEGASLSGQIAYRREGKVLREHFRTKFPLVDGAVGLRVDPYPHRRIATYDTENNEVRHLPSHAMSIGLSPSIFRDMEVLYIGQAFGDGTRSALDRLRGHSTLQKILADAQYKYPDDEVVLITFEYPPCRVITIFDGANKTAIRDKSDTRRFTSILEKPLTEHQQICLAEAGLIRYFAPEYNEIYKASFPATDQKILSACQNLDFSGLIVEIDTSECGFYLHSNEVKSAMHHTCKYDLIDANARQSFFTFGDGAVTIDGVISPSR